MKTFLKKFGKFIITAVLAIFAIFTTALFKECRKGGLSEKISIAKSIENFKNGIDSINSQCPAEYNSWTIIESFEMVNNVVTVKFVVDDDIIDAMTYDGFKYDMISILEKQFCDGLMGKINFGNFLNKANITIKLLVYRSNGGLEYSIEIDGNDFKKIHSGMKTLREMRGID